MVGDVGEDKQKGPAAVSSTNLQQLELKGTSILNAVPMTEALEGPLSQQPFAGNEPIEEMLGKVTVEQSVEVLRNVYHFLGELSPTAQLILRSHISELLKPVCDTATSEPLFSDPDVGTDEVSSGKSKMLWKLTALVLQQQFCKLLCSAGTKLDCQTGAMIVGIFGVVQPPFTGLASRELFKMAISAVVCSLIFSAWVVKASISGTPYASSSTLLSLKGRCLEKISNLLGGVAFIGVAMGTFTNIFYQLPPAYAASSIASCLAFVGAAAFLSYRAG